MIEDIALCKSYGFDVVYSVGLQFPSVLIKTFFDWESGRKMASCDPDCYFVVGNYYAAFSNNKELKFYVHDLQRGFVTIEDALNSLIRAGFEDLSNFRIIEIQYLNPSSIPEILHHSSEWSPFTDGKFNLPSNEWEDKFKAVLSEREGRHHSYIEECLAKLAHTKFNDGEVCTDVDGNKHLIYPSKIIKISPYPYSKDDKVFATVTLEGNVSLTVELLIFTKELTGDDLRKHSTSSGKQVSTVINVPTEDLSEVFKSIEEELSPIKEKMKQEVEAMTKSSVTDDDEKFFDPDYLDPEDEE